MRLAFLGTPEFSVPTLAALIEAGHEIACIYSQPPAPRGRGRALAPSPVAAFAIARGLALRTPVSLRDPEELSTFAGLDLDLAVVVAFGQILDRAVLEAPRLGCLNLHASLLPRWRGAAPIQRALMAGDSVTGVDVMRMEEGLDTGPVLASASTRIDALDTAGALAERLSHMGARLMVQTLSALAQGRAEARPQSTDGMTYARKIRPAETRLRWSRPAWRIDRQIRGLSPIPGAWFEAPSPRGPIRVKALLSRQEDGEGAPGEALDDRLLIACGEGAVRLLRVQREGREVADAAEFLRGFQIPTGARLG